MKTSTWHADESAPRSVNEFIQLKTGLNTIQIGFTDQRVSAHAGLATFVGFLHWHRFRRVLATALPSRARGLPASDLALGFLIGLLSGAKKLAQVAWLRRDALLPELLQIQRLGSQPTFTRFFQRFTSPGGNLAAFRPLWHWCADRLCSRPGGFTLDLDSTKLLHEDGRQEGVRTAPTPQGFRRCLHPLLAVLAEAKLVVGFWLRPGHATCDSNVLSFTLDLLAQLPRHVRVRLVRADSGFCHGEWLALLESQRLPYIVVARLYEPVQRLLKKELHWQATEVPGTEVAETVYGARDWRTARRLILVRHRIAEKERPTGKRLLDCPGYAYQALVTSLPTTVRPLTVWREYNGRAGTENVIKELAAQFGLPQLCLKKFWSTEAALSLAVLSYNLCVLFQRQLGWLERVSAGTLRFRVFQTGGIVSETAGRTTIRLAVPSGERAWWRCVFEKLTSPYPNCNSVPSWSS